MLPTPKEVRAKSFEDINRDILTDHHRRVLDRALNKRGGLCSEDFYFNPCPEGPKAWGHLQYWGFFAHRKDADPSRPLTNWYLTKMGLALAHYIAKQEQEAA